MLYKLQHAMSFFFLLPIYFRSCFHQTKMLSHFIRIRCHIVYFVFIRITVVWSRGIDQVIKTYMYTYVVVCALPKELLSVF